MVIIEKKQLVVIHGGETFATYEDYLFFLKNEEIDLSQLSQKRWKDHLSEAFLHEYEMIQPRMPNSLNAKYVEWKIWFEKFLPFLHDEVVLLGHSLGAIFLVKYLCENNFPKKISGLFLVAGPYDDKDSDYSLADFVLPKELNMLRTLGNKVHLYYSKDDVVVPFVDLEKYKKQLPEARITVFENRNHFEQSEFPEIVEDIKRLVSNSLAG